jgi:hypothetical protein
MTNKFISYFKEEAKVPGKGSYFTSLAINIVLLYVVNNLRYMGITQLTEAKLISCMWSLNIIFGLAIIGNFTLILYRPKWLFYLVQTLINAAGVNAFFFIYQLYPFNLGNPTLDSIIKIILVLIMIGFFLAFLLEFYRFGINVKFAKKKHAPVVIAVEAGQSALSGETPATENPPSAGNDAAPAASSGPSEPSPANLQSLSDGPPQDTSSAPSNPEQSSHPPTL